MRSIYKSLNTRTESLQRLYNELTLTFSSNEIENGLKTQFEEYFTKFNEIVQETMSLLNNLSSESMNYITENQFLKLKLKFIKLQKKSIKSLEIRRNTIKLSKTSKILWKLSAKSENAIRIAEMPEVLYCIANSSITKYPNSLQTSIVGILYNVSLSNAGINKIMKYQKMYERLSKIEATNPDAKTLIKKLNRFKPIL